MKKVIDRDLPLKQEISANIKRLMKERDWTQIELSEKSGISKSTLSDYINCKTLIKPGNVEKLSDAFKVPKSYIDPSFIPAELNKENIHKAVDQAAANMRLQQEALKKKTEMYRLSAHEGYKKLPIVGSISCGNGVLAYEDIEGYEDTPKSWLNGGEYFYLRAKGDSMINARIHDGDLLLIRQQDSVETGEIAAVLIDGDALLKRIYIEGNTVILQSENPNYNPIIVDGNKIIKIIGKLKKVVLNF